MDNDEQLADRLDGLQVWLTLGGERVAPYTTDAVFEANLQTIFEWSAANIPAGVGAAKEAGFYELGFNATLAAGLLQRDPSWVSQSDKDAVLQKELDRLPAAELKTRYFAEPSVRRLIDKGGQ